MKVFGIDINWPRAQTSVPTGIGYGAGGGGWFNVVGEWFAGAWQKVMPVGTTRDILAFSGVFASVTLIASDIAKLDPQLTMEGADGIYAPVVFISPFTRVLRKPNRYQTWLKFAEQWIVSKLLYGNTYVLKVRDGRGIVVEMHVLNAQSVTPLITDDGDVYYQLGRSKLASVNKQIAAPSSEIIHDSMVGLWHPLVGISPIYACGVSAIMGTRIQANSTSFFGNASRPSGMLTSPNEITAETALRLKEAWEQNYSGPNAGRLAVGGNGLKYEAMTIPAVDAQLIEQLKWTVEDVARCFHVPTWKLGDKEPLRTSVESLNQTYYSDCLQIHIEAMEALLVEGLELPSWYKVKLDLDGLLRMDTAARYLAKGQAVKDGWMTPNEARKPEGLPPVPGGDACYLQQQNFSLDALSKRDAKPDPFASGAKPPPAAPSDPGGAPPPAAANDDVAVFLEYVTENLKWAA